MAFSMTTLSAPFITHRTSFPANKGSLVLPRNSLRINAVSKKYEPTQVVPQADRVLIRLEELPEKSAGGVLLPKSAVKFERYLVGEVLSVGAEAGELETGKKVMFSDINAYEALFRKIAAALPGMEIISSAKQEDMVDVNLKSTNNNTSQSQQSGGCAC